MSEFWYYTKDNETRGPIALDQLIKLLGASKNDAFSM